MAIPTCLLLSLLCGWRLGATRTWGLSVVSGLLSVVFSPGGTIVWLGAWGSSWTPSSGHLSCQGGEGECGWARERAWPCLASHPTSSACLKKNYVEVQLIYNVVLVSSV